MLSGVFLILATAAFFITLIGIGLRFGRGRLTDIVTLFALVFGLFYGLRALLLVTGLDVPYPERFFELSRTPDLAATTLLWLTLFLAAFGVGVYITGDLLASKHTLFFARRTPPDERLVAATAVLTVVATLISLYMIYRYGGVGNFIRAVKIDKSLAGLYFLKVPAAVGALCAVATFVQLRRSPRTTFKSLSWPIFVCAVLNGYWVFIWGQRSTLVILGVMLLLATLATRERRPSAVSAVLALVLAGAIVLGVSTGLRYARDELVAGEVQDVVGDASVWRQVSIGTNSVYFDSSMLAFRDWPAEYDYRHGEDFALSAAGFVPRILWSGKPETVVAGKWFRQVYQPRIVNGWPVGAPTLWWLNFGPIGVPLGGLVSGLVFGVIRRAQVNSANSSLNVGIALVTAIYVFQTGVGPEWPVYFTAWLAPMWLLSWFVSRGQSAGADEPALAASVRAVDR